MKIHEFHNFKSPLFLCEISDLLSSSCPIINQREDRKIFDFQVKARGLQPADQPRTHCLATERALGELYR